MSDFTNDFWSTYIAAATLLSVLACALLLWITARKKVKATVDANGVVDNTTGHVWDEDLREANNPLPRWWVGLFIITIVYGLGYLVMYPGLGSYAGKFGWSTRAEYDKSVVDAEKALEPLYARFAAMPPEKLAGDPAAMAIGERLFMNNCAQCHGSDARGGKSFPNLTDTDWLHGGAPDKIIETVTKGRIGQMPPMAAAVGTPDDVKNVANYVLSLSGSPHDSLRAQLGRSKFVACAACHGMDGKGNQGLGAPNLTDDTWLHGWGENAIVAMVNNGKTNQMPAQAGKLTEGQIKVVASYVWGAVEQGRAVMPDEPPRKVIPIVPVRTTRASSGELAVPANDDVMVSLYEASRKIYARSVHGVFARWRIAFVFLTQLVFYGLPWLEWGQRQAVLFDLGARRFYIFGLVLYPQDFIYLTGLLVISALALFLFTAVAGRLWCGYACPQTVYTEMFMWIERKVEGERGARIKLDGSAFSAEKLVKKWFKHVLWIGLALWTGFIFVGYFTPVRELGLEFLQTRMGSWEVFWVFFYGFATYGNAGFMREQVCKYMCPYARFQSAMFDHDTLVVGYDVRRGEPRGARGRKDDFAAKGLGSCVDCHLCVHVCPTGIDIRDGLQYECIGCGACIDACDSVMDKMDYPRGLIRYATQNALAGKAEARSLLRHALRPRVLVYTALLVTLCMAVLSSLVLRTPLKVDVVRDRASLSRIVAGSRLENVYRLQVMNATEATQHYRIGAQGLPGLTVSPPELLEAGLEVGPAQSRWVAVRLQVPYEGAVAGSHEIHFEVGAVGGGVHVTEKSAFIVPR